MNPQVPYHEVDNIFTNIKMHVADHPLPTYNKQILWYMFLVHMPVILIGQILMIHYLKKDPSNSLPTILFVTGVICMSFLLVIWAMMAKVNYRKKLKLREKELNSLLENINMGTLSRLGMIAKAGICGAWIELQFLNPNLYMSIKLRQNLFPNPNIPMATGFNMNSKPLAPQPQYGYGLPSYQTQPQFVNKAYQAPVFGNQFNQPKTPFDV